MYCDHYDYTGPAKPLCMEKADEAMDLARLETHKEEIAFVPKLPAEHNHIMDGGPIYYIGYHGNQYRFLVSGEELLTLYADITPLRAALSPGFQEEVDKMGLVDRMFWRGMAKTWTAGETSSGYTLEHIAKATGRADWYKERSLDAIARVQRAV